MMKMKKIIKPLMILMPVFVLQGCGSFNVDEYLPDKKVEYKKSKQVGNDLELPPDLTNARVGSELHVPTASGASGVATYSQFLGEKSITGRRAAGNIGVLPQIDNITLKREGKERWLVIQNSPQEVWPNVVSFWQDNGILLLEQDPTVGVMKTGWLENRADIDSDIVTDSIRRLFDGLYSAATRDQYRVRLEEGDEPGSTEVYLTHYGMQEEIKVDSA
ncbi:MAG: outer membrane protein assembly factor BamC, partial [Gammaproteobacteria bacterium]|nr:outer membrane protein assembly factor BamC [Gammaproteobacteria bacterium]